MISTETRNLLHPQVDRVVKDHESRFWMIAAAPAGVSAALMMNAGASPAMADNVMPSLSMNMPLPYEQESCAYPDEPHSNEGEVSDSVDASAKHESGRIHTYKLAIPVASSVISPCDARADLIVRSDTTHFKDSLMSGNVRLLFNIGVVSQDGQRYSLRPTNQDDFFVARTKDKLIVGVFDGHFNEGHVVSSVTRKEILDALLEPSNDDPLKAAFAAAEHELATNHGLDVMPYGGSTAVVVTIDKEGQVECANAGDSRAIIVRADGSTHDLSFDHDVHNPLERKRMFDCGADRQGNHYMKDDGTGLSVARAFGDNAFHSIGVHSTPERTSYQLQDNDRYLVVASDGLWDSCGAGPDGPLPPMGAVPPDTSTSDFAGLLVKHCVDRGLGPQRIAVALSQWAAGNQNVDLSDGLRKTGPLDDTTVVVVPLSKGQLPPTAHKSQRNVVHAL